MSVQAWAVLAFTSALELTRLMLQSSAYSVRQRMIIYMTAVGCLMRPATQHSISPTVCLLLQFYKLSPSPSRLEKTMASTDHDPWPCAQLACVFALSRRVKSVSKLHFKLLEIAPDDVTCCRQPSEKSSTLSDCSLLPSRRHRLAQQQETRLQVQPARPDAEVIHASTSAAQPPALDRQVSSTVTAERLCSNMCQ